MAACTRSPCSLHHELAAATAGDVVPRRGRKRRRGSATDPLVLEEKRRNKNQRESTRVRNIARCYKSLSLRLGWTGRKPPPKLDVLTKTIQHIQRLQKDYQRFKRMNGSQGVPVSDLSPSTSSCDTLDPCELEYTDQFTSPVVAQTVTVAASQPTNHSSLGPLLECSETLDMDDSGDESLSQVMQPDSTTHDLFIPAITACLAASSQYHVLQSLAGSAGNEAIFSPEGVFPIASCVHSGGPLLSNVSITSPGSGLFSSPTVTATLPATSPEYFQPCASHHMPGQSGSSGVTCGGPFSVAEMSPLSVIPGFSQWRI